jgi:hypothetical protein
MTGGDEEEVDSKSDDEVLDSLKAANLATCKRDAQNDLFIDT